MENNKLISPPFDEEKAGFIVKLLEDIWNTLDPEFIASKYSQDTHWRVNTEFANGREEVKTFLIQKWKSELDYKRKNNLWVFNENRVALGYEYEYHDGDGKWFKAFGNELWEFDQQGLIAKRFANINIMPIKESERKITAISLEDDTVMPDECGDSLWDRVLKEDEERQKKNS